MKETKTVEKEKVVAEMLNGRFAMMGFIALVGAYLTQILLINQFYLKKRLRLNVVITMY